MSKDALMAMKQKLTEQFLEARAAASGGSERLADELNKHH